MLIIERPEFYELDFPYNPRIISAIKERLPFARFNWSNKRWRIAKSRKEELEVFARSYGFSFEETSEPESFVINDLPNLDRPINLKLELFPYQKQGVAYNIEKKRVIIGDEMGLGKTAQVIAAVHAVEAFPCLVICPSTLKINWEREWSKWTDRKAKILDPSINRRIDIWAERGLIEVFIVNLESLKKYFVQEITKTPTGRFSTKNIKFRDSINLFKSVIIDESHRIKDSKAQQSKIVKGILKDKEYRFAITGTPVINRPKDLINQLSAIDRLEDLGGYNHFITRYCAGSNGYSNLDELRFRLTETCFFRRNKSDVLKELPPKIRQVVLCELDPEHREEYNVALGDLENYLLKYRNASETEVDSALRGEIMVRIGILKDISARGKLNDVREFITETIEEGEKLIVFLHQHKVHDRLREWFPEAVSITGRDSTEERQRSIDRFQNEESCKLIFCSIKAAGVGITLTASSRVSFVELGWHPAEMDQAEDRAHRIGQEDSVHCIYFLGKNTIDQHVFNIIQTKRDISDTITGGDSGKVEENIIEGLIELLTKKEEVL